MNLSEFKAWFEGFTENIDAATPNAKQWKRIKEKISKIVDAPPVPQRVFHDHYYSPWRRFYEGPYLVNAQIGLSAQAQSVNLSNLPQGKMQSSETFDQAELGRPVDGDVFDSGSAFRELGRAEARSMRKEQRIG